MKESEKQKYLKWYKIARKVINDKAIIPDLSDKQILGIVSKENWLIFALPSEGKKEDAYNRPDPNICMWLDKNKVGLALVFNTVDSIDKVKNILTGFHEKERKELGNILKKLDNKYETIVNRKTKEHYHLQHPTNVIIMRIKTNKLDENSIKRMFEQVAQIRKEGKTHALMAKIASATGKKYYFEGPTIELAKVKIKPNEREFKKRILELKKIFLVCSSVKSDKEISKLIRDNRKKAVELNESINNLLIRQKNVEKLISSGIGDVKLSKKKLGETMAEIKKLQKEKSNVEETLQILQNEKTKPFSSPSP